MSRTRSHANEIDLWLFPKEYTDTNGHIEQTENEVGQHFTAEDLGEKAIMEKNILSGRYFQSGTKIVYKTNNADIDWEVAHIGWNIASVPNPSRKDLSSIINVRPKPQTKRGARYNTKRIIDVIIEVS